ncbi:lytic transglycosylase domain-containing protein [Micromonospora sp. CPCC 205539]
MVDGEDRTRARPLRPAVPLDGPLEGSGAAPDPVKRVPRPRRPWLSGGAAASGPSAPAESGSDSSAYTEPTADAPKADAPKVDPAVGDLTADASSGGPKPEASSAEPKVEATSADAKVEATSADAKVEAASADAKTTTTSADDAKTGTPAGDAAKTTVDGIPASDLGRRRRVPFAHAVRLPPPRQAAATAARATRAWARRPSGRLTLPGIFLLALVAVTAAAGALLVPSAIRAPRPVAVDGSATAPTVVPSAVPSGLPGAPLPTGPLPTGGLPGGGFPTGPALGGRPSDALAGWAQQVGAKVGVPPIAMQAYGYAELVLAQTNRSCALSWTTLAAIGQVESGHGSANRAVLGQDGKAMPEIIGLPLDGKDGRMRITDTDRGSLDHDTTFDHAIGPMQFIPTTWQEIGADGDNDGVKNPHDLDDAALAAGNYLCKGGRNLSIPGDWWNAILSYNDVRRYVQDVYNTANRYGQASRS